MSNLQLVPASSCDDLLDYIYGGLPPARLQSFEEHLPTCEKCRAEVEATKKIRNLTRETLPPVEPSNDRMAAISAQLLHAAAQRKAPRGPMFRRIMQHPGFAAMAAMLVVGLFITTQWNNLKMPAKEMAPAATPTSTAAPAPAAATAPATPPAAAPIPVEQKPAETALAPELAGATKDDKKPEPSPDPSAMDKRGAKTPVANKPSDDMKLIGGVEREKNEPAKEMYATKKDAPNDAELWSRTESKAKAKKSADNLDGLFGDAYRNNAPAATGSGKAGSTSSTVASGPSGVTTSLAKPSPKPSQDYSLRSGADGNAAGEGSFDDRKQQVVAQRSQPQPSSPAKPMAKAEQALEEKPASAPAPKAVARNSYEPSAPPPPAQAPVAATATPTPSPSNGYYQNEAQSSQGNFSNLGKSRDSGSSTAEGLRRKGAAYAQSGKCAEALRMYNDANRIAPNADNNAADQLTYARCLRESGRLDAAQMALDNLQKQNVQSNAIAVENEVNVLNAQRRSAGAPTTNKASKAAPKRAAPAATEKAADSANAY